VTSVLPRLFDPFASVRAIMELGVFVRRNRSLILEMTKRELLDRFAGSVLGGMWTILAPLLIIGANVLAYLFIFRIRLQSEDSPLTYAAFVLAALAVWVAFSESIGRSPNAVAGNANLVKQIVFPAEVLPLKSAFAALPTLLTGSVIAFGLSLAVGKATLLGWLVLAPLAIAMFIAYTVGLGFLVSSVSVFFRDVREIVGVLLSIGIFLNPVFYPPASIPDWLAVVFMISPAAHLLDCFRDAYFNGAITHPLSWIVAALWAVIFLSMGWRVFRALKPAFGNAL
jgi:lipopolysaccharide transport system permease protein